MGLGFELCIFRYICIPQSKTVKHSVATQTVLPGQPWREEGASDVLMGGQVLFYLMMTQLMNTHHQVTRPVLGLYMDKDKVKYGLHCST